MPKRQKHKHQRAKGSAQTLTGLGSEAWRSHIEALLARDVEVIQRTAYRGAELTRQLMSFGPPSLVTRGRDTHSGE